MSQSLAKNLIHIVFSTKGREPLLMDPIVRGEMFAFIKGVGDQKDCPVIKVGGIADHVHILCHLSKNLAAAKLIGELKRASSLWVKQKGSQYAHFHWQGGYAYFSVSPKDVKAVADYIGGQEERHKDEGFGFKAELRYFLRKYRMPFDETYLWD